MTNKPLPIEFWLTDKTDSSGLMAELDLARISMTTGDRNWTDLVNQLNENKARLERAESLLRDVMVSMTLNWPLEAERIHKYFAEVER